VLVGDHLHLDVPASLDQPLHEDDGIAEGALRLDLGALERVREFVLRAHDADAAATAPAAGLDDERVADRGRVPEAVVQGRDRTAAPRGDRHPGLLRQHLRLDLGAEQAHGVGRRADEGHAEGGAQLGERGVLRHEAPADPRRVGTALPQRPAELLVVEVGDSLAGVPEDDGLVGGTNERRVPLVLRVQRDDADPVAVLLVELAHGPDQAHGGLAPVHHSDAFEHACNPLSVNHTQQGSESPPGRCDLDYRASISGARLPGQFREPRRRRSDAMSSVVAVAGQATSTGRVGAASTARVSTDRADPAASPPIRSASMRRGPSCSGG
jgi:hypothetical protein